MDGFKAIEINWNLVAPIIILQFLLLIIALITLIRTERTNGPKWMWAAIILFVSYFGSILFFIVGRRKE
ncbi:PLD nuclease N-terminal domain-containing protein [Paenibacillus solani]|uniref:PLD nuclease N-terminal domain-containing protein n=1 Tax=Paenibacillus solani TaxID=1705565 RepID=UPI003D2B0248